MLTHDNRLDILLKQIRHLHKTEIDLSLDRLEKLLIKCNNIHHKLPPIIHVAGTNGKGSTIAFIRSILQTIGKNYHSYTSPHLISWCERVCISNKEVAIQELSDALELVIKINNQQEITIFEAFTAAAFILFSNTKVAFLLLEVGLGGRLDATNVVSQPKSTIITPISLDHQDWLGDDLSKIAHAKAGIIKANCPVIIAPQPEIVMHILQEQAKQLKAPCFRAGHEWHLEKRYLKYQDKIYQLPEKMGLIGDHQYINAATAIITLLVSGIDLSQQNITDGLTQATWPGRLQNITLPLSKHEIWLDGAHNPGGADAIGPTLAIWKKEKPLYAIIAMKKDKNAKEFLKIIKPHFNHIIFTSMTDSDQCDNFYSSAKLYEIFEGNNIAYSMVNSWVEAIKLLQFYESGRILITGSLYLIGDVLAKK